MLFKPIAKDHAEYVDEYLKALKPVPSPNLVQGKLSAAAQRGKEVFETAKCSKCHDAPLFTAMKGHRVGTGTRRAVDTRFDTPTLIEIWRTAPYLHDGRAGNVSEVMTTVNKQDFHGATSGLTCAAVCDLAA